MADEDLFEGLSDHERNEAEHGDEVRQRWGETDAFAASHRRTRNYTPQDWAQFRAEAARIEAALADLLSRGVSGEDDSVQDLAEQHRLMIDRWYYSCSHEMHTALGDLYGADARFAAHYDEQMPGLAVYLRHAIYANARRHG